MNKYFNLLGILLLLSLLAVPLTGCENAPWDSGMTLILKDITPKDGTSVNTPSVTVRGDVKGSESAGAKVSINDADAPVKDGKFSTDITLIEGKNVISIVATAGQAKLTEKVTVTYVPAKQ